MRIKILALLSLSFAVLLLSGCDSGRSQIGAKETNVLGIAKLEKDAYLATGPNTIAVSTDELYGRKNFQGDQLTLLWGLITLKDY